MTKNEMNTMWNILDAWRNGKTIQIRVSTSPDVWEDMLIADPSFKGGVENYRIKVEPKILYHCIYKREGEFYTSRFFESLEEMEYWIRKKYQFKIVEYLSFKKPQ